jgi:NitT/TauT family transport system substrate-binding protein
MRYRRCIRVVGCLLACAFVVLSGNAWALDKVKLRLDWIPGAEHAFVYLAKEKGWFQAEGIDLEILPGQGSTVAVKLVGNRDDEFAFSDAATLVSAWERGVPLVSLMVLYHDTPTVLVTKDGSDIKSLKDICGRKIGVMIKSTTYVQFKGMLAAAGIECQFEEVPASPGGRELMADVVVAQHHYGFLIAPLMEQKGIKPRLIPARDYFHFYSQSIITNEAMITEKRDLVARFMRALVRGLRYSLEHPDETLSSFLKAHKEANKDYEQGKLAIVNKMFSDPGTHSEKLGMQSVAGWAETAQALHKIKVTEKLVDTKGRFTNEFLQ